MLITSLWSHILLVVLGVICRENGEVLLNFVYSTCVYCLGCLIDSRLWYIYIKCLQKLNKKGFKLQHFLAF